MKNPSKADVMHAAICGVCPECANSLQVNRLEHIACPNHHDLDYNKRLNHVKSIWRDTEIHYDLSDCTNLIYENTNHPDIKRNFDRFYAWLSD